MSLVALSTVVVAAAEENVLPVPSVVFPIVALGLFLVLGAVTWSYRDVARRHADKAGGDAPHGH